MATPTPSISTEGACGDPAFNIGDPFDGPWEWYFNESSVPARYDTDEVLAVLQNSVTNITAAVNDCGLPDNVSARATYMGTTAATPCAGDFGDDTNVIGFGETVGRRLDRAIAYACPYGAVDRPTVEADILINIQVRFSLLEQVCGGRQEILEATLTHEVGHVFGLGHVGEGRHGDLTMSTRSNGPCTTEEISLGLGDVLGLEALY